MINRSILQKIYNILFGTALGTILLFAVYYHIHIFLFNASNSFVNDECCLVFNAMSLPWYKLFLNLPNGQCTPPAFSLITKCLIKIFHINEPYFRSFPFIATIAAILLFPILEFKIIKNRFGILFALGLLVTNQCLYEFSFFYKPYETDILLSIVLLFFAIHIKDKEFSQKEAFGLGIATCIVSMLSYTADIVIAGIFFAKILYDKYKNKKFIIKNYLYYLSPIAFYLLYLIIFVIIPLKQEGFLDDYWFSSMYAVENLTIQSYSNTIWQNAANLIMSGYEQTSCNLLILGTLLLGSLVILFKKDKFLFYFYMTEIPTIILLSLLKIYPFAPQRVILYLCPLVYILLSKVFDITFFRKKILSAIVFVMFVFLMNYNNSYHSFVKIMNNPLYREGSPIKYYYKLLKHSDLKPTDYIFWYMPREIRLYNYNSELKIKNENKQLVYHDELKYIPKGSIVFLYLSDEYYYDYYYEYNCIKKFIDNDCNIIYSVFDDLGTNAGYFIKCQKTTDKVIDETQINE